MFSQAQLFSFIRLRAIVLVFFLVLTMPTSVWAEDETATLRPQEIRALLSNDEPLDFAPAANNSDLRAFYEKRGYAPAWSLSPEHKDTLKGFLASTRDFASYHGLAEEAYPIDALEKRIDALASPADANKLELLITSWLLQIGHDLQGDNVNLTHLYPGWTFARPKQDIPSGLAEAVANDKVQNFFDSLPPQTVTYAHLAEALKTYRAYWTREKSWPRVLAGPAIKPGMTDTRLAAVRARLKAEDYTFPQAMNGEAFYDNGLKEAVIAYQSRNGLQADGNIGARTFAAFNVTLAERISQIRANMERMRHEPDTMPPRYARVNIADASVEVVDNGQTIYHDVVIVGQADRKTPFIQSAIRSVIFNPSWTVPAKIAREDILPKLRKDPHYLEKMGFVIKESADDPHGEHIDWKAIKASEFNFRLRQSPGDLNSLGQIKFDFDNDFSVYLHDTSHPEKFAEPERFLSSGCVRIKSPLRMAEVVLAHTQGAWSQQTIQQSIDSQKSRWLKVEDPLPLFIVYETAFFPTPESAIHFRRDVYGYDSLLLDALARARSKR